VYDVGAVLLVPDNGVLKVVSDRDEAAAGTPALAWGHVDQHEAIPYACDGGSDND
jgi:hypothetical protein